MLALNNVYESKNQVEKTKASRAVKSYPLVRKRPTIETATLAIL